MNTKNLREYLKAQKIAEFNDITVYKYCDRNSMKDCFIVEGYAANSKNIESCNDYLHSILKFTNNNIAQIGSDASVITNNEDIVVFLDNKASDISNLFLHDHTKRQYTISFITTSLHTYLCIGKPQSGERYYFGYSGLNGADFYQDSFIRNDAPHHAQFFRGFEINKPGKLSPIANRGSVFVEFNISEEQLFKAAYMIKKHADYIKQPYAMPYHLFFNNCNCFANNIFQATFFSKKSAARHFYSYNIMDELDLRDPGILYNMFLEVRNPMYLLLHLDFVLDAMLVHFKKQTLTEILCNSYIQHPYLRFFLNDYDNKQLHLAAHDEDLSNIDEIDYDDVNVQNTLNQTPLHIAALSVNYMAVKKLIKCGANVNIKDEGGKTPLFYLIEKGNKNDENYREAVNMLIERTEHFADFDATHIYNILFVAAKVDDAESLRAILNKSPEAINALNEFGSNVLHVAYEKSSKNCISYISNAYPHLELMLNTEGFSPSEIMYRDGFFFYERTKADELFHFLNSLPKPEILTDELKDAIEMIDSLYPNIEEAMLLQESGHSYWV